MGTASRLFLVLLMLLVAGGCAMVPRYIVSVDSINDGVGIADKSYILLPANKDITTADLQFKEFAQYVARALETNGYVGVQEEGKANIAILLAYKVGDPQEHQYAYEVPVYGQTGVSASTTQTTVNRSGGVATVNSRTSYIPQYGVVGYSSKADSFVTYTCTVTLTAVDLKDYKNNKLDKQLWKTEIISVGHSGDLRRVFPALLAAAAPYLGDNTGNRMDVVLRENDKSILRIKGISLPTAAPKNKAR